MTLCGVFYVTGCSCECVGCVCDRQGSQFSRCGVRDWDREECLDRTTRTRHPWNGVCVRCVLESGGRGRRLSWSHVFRTS